MPNSSCIVVEQTAMIRMLELPIRFVGVKVILGSDASGVFLKVRQAWFKLQAFGI